MLSSLQQLHDKTKALASKLSNTEFEQLEKLVEERELVLQHCIDHWDEESLHKDLIKSEIKSILGYDEKIVNRMNELMQEGQDGLAHLNKLKQQKHSYQGEHPAASIFFDEKK